MSIDYNVFHLTIDPVVLCALVQLVASIIRKYVREPAKTDPAGKG